MREWAEYAFVLIVLLVVGWLVFPHLPPQLPW
jgi:uncharacterized membrane protein YhdT